MCLQTQLTSKDFVMSQKLNCVSLFLLIHMAHNEFLLINKSKISLLTAALLHASNSLILKPHAYSIYTLSPMLQPHPF